MKKIAITVIIVWNILNLAACNTTRQSHHSTQQEWRDSVIEAARTPLPGEPNYRGDQTTPYKNPMFAPANQVYYFGFDSSHLNSEDELTLHRQANYLASHPNTAIRLEGNTDNRGSREYNIGLGWRRAQSVALLLEQWGVNPHQIQMLSYGKENPVLDENNEKAWTLNRRVNLIYKAD